MIKKKFIGRNRSKNQPEKGRFNAVNFNAITRTTWKNYHRLLPDAPEFQTRLTLQAVVQTKGSLR